MKVIINRLIDRFKVREFVCPGGYVFIYQAGTPKMFVEHVSFARKQEKRQ